MLIIENIYIYKIVISNENVISVNKHRLHRLKKIEKCDIK